MAGTFTTRNTPLLAADGGSQSETLAGTQLLTTLFDVPVEANSAWLQAATDVLFRIDGSTSGSAWLTLPAKTFLPLTNRSQLNALVLSGSSVVAVQFMAGALGPMPPAPIVAATSGGGGGGTVTSVDVSTVTADTGFLFAGGPVVSDGVISMTGRARVDTANAVHVMKSGDDATGLRGRLDRPFLTITAAKAVLQAGDVMYIWPGLYQEGEIDRYGVTYYLLGATIEAPNTSTCVFNCLSGPNGSTMDIVGSGLITRATGGTVAPLIITNTFDARITVDGPALTNLNGPISFTNRDFGTLNITSRCISVTDQDVFGQWTLLTIRGEVSAQGTGIVLRLRDGDISNLYGLLYTAGSAVVNKGGRANVYGDVIQDPSSPATLIDISNANSKMSVYGNVSAGLSNAVIIAEGECFIYGSVSSRWTAIQSTGLAKVSVHGDIYSEAIGGVYAFEGTVKVWGTIRCAGANLDANPVYVQGPATVEVWGDLESVGAAAAKTDDGFLHVHGNCTAQNRWGAFVQNGGEIIVDGTASGGINGAWLHGLVTPGKMTLRGGAKTLPGGGTNSAVLITGGVGNILTLAASCFIEQPLGLSVENSSSPLVPDTFRSYGAGGLTTYSAGLSVVGTFNVIP